MIIQKIDINKINPAQYNPRLDLKPGDSEYEKIKRSISEFDLVEPLVWNRRTGNLVGGHQRLKVLKEKGLESVEVSVVDLAPSKEKALNVALNKVQGDWDLPKLKDLLTELDTGEFDIEITGFDDKEIEKLMLQFYEPQVDEKDDIVPEVPEEPVTKPGDLYILGDHRLLCGDATSIEDVERLMDRQVSDMVFTDPPYNINYTGTKNKKWQGLKNDNLSPDDFVDFLYKAFSNYNTFSKSSAAAYTCHADKSNTEFKKAFAKSGYEWRATLIWVKNSAAYNMAQYRYRHEPIFYLYKKGQSASWYGDHMQTTVWEAKKESGEHPHN
jgi:hypothetical protein